VDHLGFDQNDPPDDAREANENGQTEEELAALQREYEELVGSVDAIIWKGEARPLRFTFVSHQAEAILGYPVGRWLAEPSFWADHIHPEDREWAVSFCQKAIENKRSHSFEYRMIGADGKVVWIRDIVHVAVEGGVPTQVFGVMIDVTGRRRAEEALKESEERFRTAFEDAPIGVAFVELDGRRFRANRSLCEMLGCSEQDLLGKDYLEHVHPDDREISTEHFRQTLEEGVGTYTLERRYLHADGHVVWNLTSVSLIRDSEENPKYFVCLHQDITESKEAEEQVRFQANLLDAVGEAVVATDPDGKIVYWNRAAEDLYGWSAEEVMGRSGIEVTLSEHLWERADDMMSELRAMGDWSGEYEMRRKDGTLFPVLITVTSVHDERGELVGIIGVSTDITERKRAEKALKESQQRFRNAFRDAAIGMALVRIDGRFLQVNHSLCRIVGYSEEELLEKTFQEITHPDDLDADLGQMRRMLDGEIETYQMEKRYFHKEGHVVWILLSASLVHDEDGEPLYFIAQVQDITERKRMEEQLRHQAFHDHLTDLPNRSLFADRLGQALRRTGRNPGRNSGRKAAVLFMDLDNFKVVNDSLGHEVGDLLLVMVSERLRRSLRPEDTLARFGGDEYTVLLEDVENLEDPIRVAERIIEEFRKPFVLDGKELFLRASIGIALGDARQKQPEDLLRDADTAMYQAKENFVGYQVFDPAMYERAVSRLKLENDLRRAIEAYEFVIHYQPIVNLEIGEVWGVEAFVRWEHPERGLLDPSEFVPMAEKADLILPMGRWVLEEACRQAQEWEREHPHLPPLVMCVNLSAKQLRYSDVAETVEEALRETGLEARCLNLDITETLYIETLRGHTSALDKLKRMGVRISIDDFGVGYSSLAYLKRLPADALKIDKSFIGGLDEDIEDTAIVQMIIDLAHTLGMEVIAEGVESEGQVTRLLEMGCDLAQGFFFAEPLPPRAASEFLAR
jgi:diguanylate cyclase (GGDEF)-like protein/PAS domain S-box-containing protein